MTETPRVSHSGAKRSTLRLQGLLVLVAAAVIVALCPTVADARTPGRVSGLSLAAHRQAGQVVVKWHRLRSATYQLRWATSRAGLAHAGVRSSSRPGRTHLGTTSRRYAWVQVRASRGGAVGPWSTRHLAVRRPKATSTSAPTAPVVVPQHTVGGFDDDFDGNSLNGSHWRRESGSGYGIESFKADSDLVTLDGQGHAVVSAKKNADGSWRGGMISTRNLFSMKSGTVEIRAKLPTAQGAWPAMWMINNLYGQLHTEIDIMELFPGGGVNGPGSYFTIHDWTQDPQWGDNLQPSVRAADGGFHTWKMVWSPTSIQLFIDGVSQGEFNSNGIKRWVWGKANLDLVLNMAVGGSWGGAVNPAPGTKQLDMVVDYVHVTKTS